MANLLKFLFGADKNKKMTNTQDSTAQDFEKYSNLDFQWIKGENLSTPEKFKGIKTVGDFIFIEFQSGRRINKDLVDEYMVTFPALPEPPPPPPPQVHTHSSDEPHQKKQISESEVTSIVYGDEKSIELDSPIYKLLRKQKKNMVEVQIKIKMNLPPKDLYNVLLTSFDDAENEITKFILDGVDIDAIKSALSDSVKKNYYSTPKKANEEKSQMKEITKTEETYEE